MWKYYDFSMLDNDLKRPFSTNITALAKQNPPLSLARAHTLISPGPYNPYKCWTRLDLSSIWATTISAVVRNNNSNPKRKKRKNLP